ncbi:TPA: DNA-binding response regulator [Candidatus Peregrinibacteria bacterium]|nr:DNA-binding response regulator [Candidatus Peregrinibacteria bacterium]
MKTILIIEDDHHIADLVKLYCEKEGFRAITAYDGEEGLELTRKTSLACVILDLMLPKKDGMEVLKEIRTEQDTPVIILTAKEEEIEKILGLEIGADDYVTKPFSPKELIARIKAVLRRTNRAVKTQDTISIKNLLINGSKFEVKKGSKVIELSVLEFKLLQVLASSPGRVFTREQLMASIYDSGSKLVFDRTIDVHIKNLRKKLGDDPKKPDYIESIFGMGYKFKEDE